MSSGVVLRQASLSLALVAGVGAAEAQTVYKCPASAGKFIFQPRPCPGKTAAEHRFAPLSATDREALGRTWRWDSLKYTEQQCLEGSSFSCEQLSGALSSVPSPARRQTVYKCPDSSGRMSYQEQPCTGQVPVPGGGGRAATPSRFTGYTPEERRTIAKNMGFPEYAVRSAETQCLQGNPSLCIGLERYKTKTLEQATREDIAEARAKCQRGDKDACAIATNLEQSLAARESLK